jgi:uncharacterized protein
MSEAAFEGVGWAFPVRVESGVPQLGRLAPTVKPPPPGESLPIELARAERSIRESILLIVGTARGERIMRPEFGCGLHELVFEPNDVMTATRASSDIRESLIDWEPRIEVLAVQAAADPDDADKLVITVDYRVRSTNNVFNLVYPFYLSGAGARTT